ncbi:MAG: tetratricopeptide repeat protein, partial [Anaerolineae bacterium]|nr:tetratricopeptide repeat protein [Anaerolineae bacterium]
AELTTLNNIGGVYDALGEKQEALRYYEQALPLFRQVGDRSGEAKTLNNMAAIYFHQGELERAADMVAGAVRTLREIGAVAEEAALLFNLAFVLGHYLGRQEEAIEHLTRSIDILHRYNLPLDAAGYTLAQHEALLAQLTGEQR